MRASDNEFRFRFWITLGIYNVAFACWPLDRRDVSGFFTKLFPVTAIGAGLGFLIAAVLAACAAGLVSWSSAYVRNDQAASSALLGSGPYGRVRNGQYWGTWLFWFAFGLLLNRLGLFIVAVGMAVFLYRLKRRGESQSAAMAELACARPNWMLALLRSAHLWIAAGGLVALALSLKESWFFSFLAAAFLVRTIGILRVKSLTRQLGLAVIAVVLCFHTSAEVITSQYNNARTCATLHEKTLTPSNVRADRFGKLFSFQVDGDVYAQPLYMHDLEIPGKGKHSVLFVATEHDSVYAFDADGNLLEPLWHVSFVDPEQHATSVPPMDLRCPFIRPEVGITPTPVIDPTTDTLYVVARTKENKQYPQRLHALDVRTGAEKFGSPVLISASVASRTQGGEARIEFDSLRQNPRAALLLVHGLVYITWASSCDVGAYHGWVMAYDAHTLTQRAVFNTSPDGEAGGIWQGDAGPAADKNGNVFLLTGNGDFDAVRGGRNYGQSILKLGWDGGALTVRDYFTPFNFAKLNREDADLGSSGPLLLPHQRGRHSHLLLAAGKGDGPIYVIDRNQMGNYREGDNPQAAQILPGQKDCFGAPAYWNRNVYYVCEEDVLKEFRVDHGRLLPQPVAQGSHKFHGAGVIPAISANGRTNGIAWLIEMPSHFTKDAPAVLHAFDAADNTNELYNSEQNGGRDRAGIALRFSIPTVANGKVYVGSRGEVDVYGLLTPARKR